ncbi:MAG: hypothetical protein GC178_06130 [Flavobacteriales bacterium]|nr:hypothetical protein [Flavobacteriales bacterium]
MNDAQSNRLDMYLVVSGFYTDNQTVIDTVPARAAAFAQLNANITAINSRVAGQSATSKGVTLDKKAVRAALDNLTHATVSSARAWAIATGNNTLAEELNYPLSDIERIKDDTMQGFCDYRIQIVNDNLVALADYGIDATTVTAWQDALDAYVAVLEAPRVAINTKHLNTVGLKELFSQTAKLFKEQLNPLMVPFKTSDPELYAAYQQACIIIDRGSTSSKTVPVPADTIEIGAYIHSSDTDLPIAGATLTIVIATDVEPVTATTDADGFLNMTIKGLKPDTTGNFDTTITAAGYDPISGSFEMTSGMRYSFDIPMDPMVVPPPAG